MLYEKTERFYNLLYERRSYLFAKREQSYKIYWVSSSTITKVWAKIETRKVRMTQKKDRLLEISHEQTKDQDSLWKNRDRQDMINFDKQKEDTIFFELCEFQQSLHQEFLKKSDFTDKIDTQKQKIQMRIKTTKSFWENKADMHRNIYIKNI